MRDNLSLAYCDYIADRINAHLSGDVVNNNYYIKDVGKIKWDLHPIDGYMQSTKKTINVTDINGKKYRVTVEELNE
jgi:hypothetical protein